HDGGAPAPARRAEPLVLPVLVQAVDAEVHPEAASVDLVDTESPRHRAQGARAEERRRAASQAIGRGTGRANKAKPSPGKVGNRFAPRPVADADTNVVPPEPRAERAGAVDGLRDGRAVGKRQREQVDCLLVVGNDLLEDAEPLAVDEAVVLVDEEELSISCHAGLRQLALIELLER